MSLSGVVVGPHRKGGTTHSGRRRWRSSCLFARRPWRDCMGGPRIGKLPARLLQERRRWGQGCDPRPHHRLPPPLRRLAAGSTGESCRALESHPAVVVTRPLSWPARPGKHDIVPHISASSNDGRSAREHHRSRRRLSDMATGQALGQFAQGPKRARSAASQPPRASKEFSVGAWLVARPALVF